MRDTDNHLGHAIKEARLAMGLTREVFAERVDISPRYLANIENSNKNPSFNVVIDIARELSLSIDEVIFHEKSLAKDRKTELIEKINRCDENSLEILEVLTNALLNLQNKHER